jgi:flagellar hook assembly protein FlgD
LTTGKHTASVTVWNINNESTIQNLDFNVEQTASLTLSHVLNYPNPFSTHTDFYFEQNQTNQTLNVLIQIFTVTGKLIKTITTNYYTDGNRSIPISWDGKDDYGDPIARGVYIYKLSVKNEQQQVAQKYEKLVILK